LDIFTIPTFSDLFYSYYETHFWAILTLTWRNSFAYFVTLLLRNYFLAILAFS
jgi:hypothetical protein